jgi:hypothetical protein
MEKTVPELMAAISPEEWAQVPVSVLNLIEEVVEIPPIEPIVTEHQFFSMTCNCCGQ